MKLKVLRQYGSPRGSWKAGEEIEVDEELGLWLLDDAPGSFEKIEEKALDEPPEDKMVKSAPKKKGWRK